MSRLTDSEFEMAKERLNEAIHEVVFAIRHADNDELDDTLTCLVSASMTLETVANEIAELEKSDARNS